MGVVLELYRNGKLIIFHCLEHVYTCSLVRANYVAKQLVYFAPSIMSHVYVMAALL